MKLPRGTLDRLWNDPANWPGFGIYYCEEDPRTIVPKKIRGLGWTMNFAHQWGWIALSVMLLLPVLPVVYFKSVNEPMGIVLVLTLWVIALIVACRVMSSTSRYEDG